VGALGGNLQHHDRELGQQDIEKVQTFTKHFLSTGGKSISPLASLS